jgi:hypothetical protein
MANASPHTCIFTRTQASLPLLLEVPYHWLLSLRHMIMGAGCSPAIAWMLAHPVRTHLRQCTQLVRCCCPCRTPDAICITNWHLPSHDTVMTHQHTCRCPCFPICARGFVTLSVIVTRQFGLWWFGQCSACVFAGVALASPPTTCWHHC